MSDEGKKPTRHTRKLLGDLESIRSLLDETQDRQGESRPGGHAPGGAEEAPTAPADASPAAEPPAGGDDDVPLLEDIVKGGVSLSETFIAGQGDFEDVEGVSSLDDDMFKALLSDEWRDSARDLLDQARAAIEQHQTEWTPAHTDELNQALKVRIDETMQHWLRQVIRERVDDLRRELLNAVADELHATISAQFEPTSSAQFEPTSSAQFEPTSSAQFEPTSTHHDEDPDGA